MTRSSSRRPPASPDRRTFLGWSTGSALALCMPPLVSGCGGGDGDSPDSTEPPAGGSISPERRQALVAELETQCRDQAGEGISKTQFLQALADFLAAQPECVRSGVDADTLTAWAYLHDGSLHMVSANRSVDPSPAPQLAEPPAPQALALGAELPGARHARVLHSFGSNFTGQATVTALTAMLGQQGYLVRSGLEGDARLTTLRNVAGDAFFYINTHGAMAPLLQGDGQEKLYCIQSSTPYEVGLDRTSEVMEDVRNLRLTYYCAATGGTTKNRWGKEVPEYETRYGITQNFVSRYWQFAPGAVVIINACSSARTSSLRWANGFIAACHRKGAGVYLGWNNLLSKHGAHRTPLYFVDRLLGANWKNDAAIQPETPVQRAFPWEEVLADMQAKGFSTDPEIVEGSDIKPASAFLAFPADNMPRELLAPSIHHVEIDEWLDQLHLFGHFGHYEADVCRVEVEGVPLREIQSWEPGKIVCQLPSSGSGSKGRVRVWHRERGSNLRHITEWQLQMRYLYREPHLPGPKVEGQLLLRLRADIGPHRERPGAEPVKPLRSAFGARGSWFRAQAGGSESGSCPKSWSGSQSYHSLPTPEEAAAGRGLAIYFRVDTAGKQGWLGLEGGSFDFTQSDCEGSERFLIGFGSREREIQFPLPLDPSIVIPIRVMDIGFGPDHTLLGQRWSDRWGRVELSWNDTPPAFPPQEDDGV